MILSFANQLAEDIFEDRQTKIVRKFPAELYRKVRMKLLYLHDTDVLTDLKVPPGNRLETLKGKVFTQLELTISGEWYLSGKAIAL